MATETNAKAGGKSVWMVLAALVVANLLVGFFLAPRHVGLHHVPLIQLPNFLAPLGVPGEWLPPHITFTWFVMALLVVDHSGKNPSWSRSAQRREHDFPPSISSHRLAPLFQRQNRACQNLWPLHMSW